MTRSKSSPRDDVGVRARVRSTVEILDPGDIDGPEVAGDGTRGGDPLAQRRLRRTRSPEDHPLAI